jgi:hypothetical protein
MGQEPSTIREDIEQTRARMGDTVEALAYKTDVKARAKDSVSGKVQSAKEKIVGVAESADEATPSPDDIQRSARHAASVAQENPLGLAIGAAAFGFLAGTLMPSTRMENEKIGPVADQVKEQAKEAASVAVEHGKEVAADAAQAARESGREHADQAKEEIKEQQGGTAQSGSGVGSRITS